MTDLDVREPLEPGSRRRPTRAARACFAALDSACQHLREADGIDAIILSAQEYAAAAAAQWCHARRASKPVDALILSNPDFGRGLDGKLDIACPVLVISSSGSQETRTAEAGAGRGASAVARTRSGSASM